MHGVIMSQQVTVTCDCNNVCAVGYFAWRNKMRGSWFVQALTDKMKSLASADIDLVRILTRVNHQVAYEFESSSKTMPKKKEVPSIVSMLTKDLYFPKK